VFDPREDKLPKWAQDELGRLRTTTSNQASRIADLTSGPEESDAFLSVGFDQEKPLGPHARIAFRLPRKPGSVVNNDVVVYRDGTDSLNINAENGSIHVLPSATNSVRIVVVHTRR
jgi:hypothetical protein